MAWTTPGTATAGDVLTAAFWNTQVRDNMVELAPFSAAWTSFTPTLAQGAATNISKTITYAKYVKVGRLVWVQASVASTAASGVTNTTITLSVPFTAASSGYIVGSGSYLDSGVAGYPAAAVLFTTTTIALFRDQNNGGRIGQDPNIAVASNDEFQYSVFYEAAS